MIRPGSPRVTFTTACLTVEGDDGAGGSLALSSVLCHPFISWSLFDLAADQGEPGSISSHLIPPDIGEGCGVETSIPLPNRPLHSVVFTEFQGPQF